ncbi:MAG: NAD-dependent epimerase/dehydratase family protein [Vicinamibacterales bacterium]
MKVLVIGSEGFIGQALVSRLLGKGGSVGGKTATQMTLLDMQIGAHPPDPRVRAIEGDICDRATS